MTRSARGEADETSTALASSLSRTQRAGSGGLLAEGDVALDEAGPPRGVIGRDVPDLGELGTARSQRGSGSSR